MIWEGAMPFYSEIRRMKSDMKARTLSGLRRLRSQLDREMPIKTRSKTLVLGTWNLRNFDDNRFMSGYRTSEDFFYIAEIISRFDVIAIQEVCDDVYPLTRVMKILGKDYDFIITDLTEGRSGNTERLGFIYDKTKVSFRGVAGELVLDDLNLIEDGEKKRQFSRTPFMCAFQSGWFKFNFSTVHVYFGSDSGEKYERRVKEIEAVAKFLKKRAARDAKKRFGKSSNHVLVGDFNIKKPGSRGFNALEKCGFKIHANNKGSNKDQTKFYDQISFLTNPNELRFAASGKEKGVFQFFKSIYRPQDFENYTQILDSVVKAKIKKINSDINSAKKKLARAKTEKTKIKAQKEIVKKSASLADWKAHLSDPNLMKKYYTKEWRTFRASDHLPLWVELEIDFSKEYLAGLANPST